MRHRPSALVTVVCGALLLTACGSSVGTTSAPPHEATPTLTVPAEGGLRPSPAGARPATPVDLVGAWRLTARDEEAGAVVTLADGDVTIWRVCGTTGGSWDGNAIGMFTAYTYRGSGGCGTQTPDWLGDASSAVVDGPDRLLLGADGRVLAELRPGGRATTRPDIEDFEVPAATADTRTASRAAAPLPAGIAAATAATLLGTWQRVPDVPQDSSGSPASMTFKKNGEMAGTDGCNGTGGTWALGPGGELLTTAGVQTLIGCDSQGTDPSGDLQDAARIGVDGPQLVLFTQDGKELSRLRPARAGRG